jgi:chemotaxis receptor (MCP) glutamine deamidase CheD
MTGVRVQNIGSKRIEKNNDNITVYILGVCLCVFTIKMSTSRAGMKTLYKKIATLEIII